MSFVATGFAALDEALGGGWPTGILIEILVQEPSPGSELSLLSPALAGLTAAQSGWVLLIAPPWIPYAPGLAQQGLAVQRVLVVEASSAAEALWAMHEALRSGSCEAVIAWLGAAGDAGRVALQRLQWLARQRSQLAVLVRARRHRRDRSPARLRLSVEPGPDRGLCVDICRNHRRPTGSVRLEPRV
jgi:cell division inhibitor SulA/protein ImuA